MQESKGFSIEQLFSQFIKEKRYVHNLSEKTLESYEAVFTRWQRLVGGFPNPTDLIDFVINMREKGLSVTTCNISIRSFNSFLSWLHKYEHAPKLKILRLKEEKRVMLTFSDQQISKIVQ